MIEDVVRQGRRGIARGEPIHLPDDLGLAVNDLCGIQTNQSAHGRAGVDIFFAVGGENPTAPNHDRGVDPPLAEWEAPNPVTRRQADSVDRTVPVSTDQEPLTIDPAHHRDCVGRVLGRLAGSGHPNGFTGVFVQSIKSVPWNCRRTPSGAQEIDEKKVPVQGWSDGPPPVAGNSPDLFGE